jgi:putative DNA primase/helicase
MTAALVRRPLRKPLNERRFEIAQTIGREIEARLEGGPDLEAKHLALIDGLAGELGQEVIEDWKLRTSQAWLRARQKAALSQKAVEEVSELAEEKSGELFISPPTQPSIAVEVAIESKGTGLALTSVPPIAKEALLLDPKIPFDNSEKLIEAYHWHFDERVRTLVHHQREFWKWNGKRWGIVDEDTFRSGVWKQLHIADKQGRRGRERFEPQPKDVSATLDALKASADLPANVSIPSWFGPSPVENPRELVALQNGLLYLPTRKLIPHNPRFWSPNVLEFSFDPRAVAPRFQQFLREVFPDDQGAQDGLLEMFGLCATDETKYQRSFMFVGPTRGGRGTIGRVLKGFIGGENYLGTSLRSLSEPFGMESYIGKKVVVYTDARIDGLATKALSTIAERLLSITGEDGQHINRKNQKYFDGQLTSRIVMFSNELPRFQDDSGALARRFLTWRMRQQFLEAQADPELTPKLLAERAGILNLALDALDRLRDRGRLVQHSTGEEMAQKLTDLASAVKAFVDDMCVVGIEHSISVDALFNRFKDWCERKGIRFTSGSNHFSNKIEAVVPKVTSSRPRSGGAGRPTLLVGIGLRPLKPLLDRPASEL